VVWTGRGANVTTPSSCSLPETQTRRDECPPWLSGHPAAPGRNRNRETWSSSAAHRERGGVTSEEEGARMLRNQEGHTPEGTEASCGAAPVEFTDPGHLLLRAQSHAAGQDSRRQCMHLSAT
jgi:hypothetical protein